MFSMIKIGLFLRGFAVVDFSAVGFLDLLKTLKTQRQKSLFLCMSDFHWQSNAFLWFDFKPHGLRIKEEKAKNYFTTRDLLISAMSHVKLIEDCRVPRRLSPVENWRAKESGKEKTGETALNLPSLPFRMVPCTSSLVTRVSRSHLFETMRKTKRLRRRLDGGDTRLYMPLNMKSMAFLLQFFESFRGKINKKIFYRKWGMDKVWDSNNYKWLCCILSIS